MNVITVTVYTKPDCQPCKMTMRSLLRAGIPYASVSAIEHADALRNAGHREAPVVQVRRNDYVVAAWSGYRPDQHELLTDWITLGSVPSSGLQNEESAREAVLTRVQALQVITDHQLNPVEFQTETGEGPFYRGSTVLDWLGY